jgi:hypothetical protein
MAEGRSAAGKGKEEADDSDSGDVFLRAFNAQLPANKQLDRGVLAPLRPTFAAAPPALLLKTEADDKLVSSLKDTNWLGAEAASDRLVRKSVVAIAKQAPALHATLKGFSAKNAEDHEIKKVKYKKKPPVEGPAMAAAAAAAVVVDEPKASAARGAMRETVEPPLLAPTQIETLEQHRVRSAQTQLFAINIERPMRTAPTDLIISTPPPVEALKYCATLKGSDVPWYEVMMATVAKNPAVTFPKTPLMRRSVLMTFLRAPDPKMDYERPCFNLDRNPYANEKGLRMRCVAHRMSAEQLGEARAFRCRELLYNGQMIKINAAVATRGAEDPRNHLQDIPELCYMCHVWLTTEAALDQYNKGVTPSADDMLIVFNKFMVQADQVGEYHRNATLCSADVSFGIWGFFPRWNERNYQAGTLSCGLPAFEENVEMLFREAPESSGQSDSIRSVPTAATRTAGFSSRQ